MHATEQASPQLDGREALSMNVTKTQPQGQTLQRPNMSGRGDKGISPGVQAKYAIERGTTYPSTPPGASLWTEPGAAITNHSNAPPSQAAWMDGPALAAVAGLNFGFHLVWTFCAIVRGMMYAFADQSAPCAFSGIWLMQPSLSLPRAMHRHAPCTPKTVRTGERPPSFMGSLAPRSWHLITETVNGVACRIHHRTTTTARASLCECPAAPQHHERNRRSTCAVHGTAEVSHHGYWMRRASALFRAVLPIADALWQIMVLSDIRHAVHGSIAVAGICACLAMELCYGLPQHRMDHNLLVVCLCRFAHHHVRSTFATLDEKRTRGFALNAAPFPRYHPRHCWRYGSALARAGGATAATYQSLSLDATTEDGTRKPSVCGSATLLATEPRPQPWTL